MSNLIKSLSYCSGVTENDARIEHFETKNFIPLLPSKIILLYLINFHIFLLFSQFVQIKGSTILLQKAFRKLVEVQLFNVEQKNPVLLIINKKLTGSQKLAFHYLYPYIIYLYLSN